MSDEIYINKSGYKCLRALLAKTEGRDPQEYEQAKRASMTEGQHDKQKMKSEVLKLKVRAPEFVEDA